MWNARVSRRITNNWSSSRVRKFTEVRRLELRYHMRNSYWSESKFAKWIARYDKPYAMTTKDWDDWHRATRKIYPIRYWFVEKFINKLQDVVLYIPDKVHEAFYWFNNTFVEKRHYLKTGLKVGQWYEFDTRLLYGIFNELVDFVEIEKAFHHVVQDKEAREKFKVPWWRMGKFGFYLRGWRCPEAGIQYLLWEAGLAHDASTGIKVTDPRYGTPTIQAEAADEVLYLYTWWKSRKYRTEEIEREAGEDDRTYYMRQNDLEQKYWNEDTEMMTRLIKIRNHLWT